LLDAPSQNFIPLEFLMSKKKKRSAEEKSAAKKATVLQTEKKSQSPLRTLAVIAVVVVAGLAFYLFQTGFDNKPQARTSSIQPEVTATEVSFPVQAFSDGQAKYFQYPAGNGITVRFFAFSSSGALTGWSGLHTTPATSVGARAKDTTRRETSWFAAIAASDLPPSR
jgi:hypothetical protein